MEKATMDANNFIANLKADGTENDVCNLKQNYDEYKKILHKVQPKERGLFSLNVLSILCRNLDKVSSWRDRINIQDLLVLSIECIREGRTLDRAERVKTLVAIYHIHRHVVKQNKPPPSLVLKLSFMPFEVDSKHLLQEYHKVYWSIFADRISYIEKIKTKINITKMTEDILKIIEICDPVEFCSKNIVFVVHKLNCLYNDNAKDFSQMLIKIFTQLSERDLEPFKNLPERELLDIYVKFNQCICKIAENALKFDINDALDVILRTCISIIGHNTDIINCQMFMNSMCSILTPNTTTDTTNTLNTMLLSLETEKRNNKAMLATYPHLQQLLRMYIEHNVAYSQSRRWTKHFGMEIQEITLRLVFHFMKKMRYCNQLSVCGDCRVKTGLHDSLRLSKLIKHYINISLSQNIPITTILPNCSSILMEQNTILNDLRSSGCSNIDKIFRALETDIHNTAISLNKARYYEYSIKFFDVYLTNELKCEEIDQKNISRGLYNKAICELDSKLYEEALLDSFLSFIFALPESLNCDKYMSLVIDIKSKELKSKFNEEMDEMERDVLQLVSVYDACKMASERNMYENLELHLSDLKYSILLKHEYCMYAKLWSSIAPIGGVWRSLLHLANGEQEDWITSVENKETVLDVLYEVMLDTPNVVRTVHSPHFTGIVDEMLNKFKNYQKLSIDMRLVYTALLFLRFEYDMAEASQEYNWKITDNEPTAEPDQVPANRTVPQEHAATKSAIVALQLLLHESHNLQLASRKYLRAVLSLYQTSAVHLLYLSRRIEALQMCHICCTIAALVGDDEAYILNAGTLLNSLPPSPALDRIVTAAAEKWSRLDAHSETYIIFLCDSALHYAKSGATGKSAKLIQVAQAHVISAYEKQPDGNWELAAGRLLEAQAALCADMSVCALTAVNVAQRHYLAGGCAADGKWCGRRLRQLSSRVRLCRASGRGAAVARRARFWRRARAAAAAALRAAAAVPAASLYKDIVDTSCTDDAQIKIDNRLKYFLDLQPSNEMQPYCTPDSSKQTPFTAKVELESMRDNMVFKRTQCSPSVPCLTVRAIKIPDFFKHSSKCTCYACDIPSCLILACETSYLEASTYFRSNETEIADNYFDRVLNMFTLTERRLKEPKKYKMYEKYIVEAVFNSYLKESKEAQIEALKELAFFRLKENNFELADDYIVTIQEIVQEIGADVYQMNEILNLKIASARLKSKKQPPVPLEVEFENLQLSPNVEPPKTPVNKTKPPTAVTKMIVKDEEIPKQRKVIKLNLDENCDDFEMPTRVTRAKKPEFKVPKISAAALEMATPRTKPKVVLTQASQEDEAVGDSSKCEFFTPHATPDAFFTPMTSVKTYSKKSIRGDIVKNLEREFSTPGTSGHKGILTKGIAVDTLKVPQRTRPQMSSKGDSLKAPVKSKDLKMPQKSLPVAQCSSDAENVPRNSTKDAAKVPQSSSVDALKVPQNSSRGVSKVPRKLPKKDVDTLKRATSPGKLSKEVKSSSRPRRLRQPVKLSVDEDDRT